MEKKSLAFAFESDYIKGLEQATKHLRTKLDENQNVPLGNKQTKQKKTPANLKSKSKWEKDKQVPPRAFESGAKRVGHLCFSNSRMLHLGSCCLFAEKKTTRSSNKFINNVW